MEKKPFSPELKSSRIVLKQNKVNVEEAQFVSNLVKKNKEFLSRWLPWAVGTYEVEDAIKFSVQCENDWEEMKVATYWIYNIDSGKLMGSIDMHHIDYTSANGEIGYWLGKEFNGQGYMREAVKILEDEFFKRGMKRIYISCDAENKASASVAEHTGYTFEGTLRNNSWSDYFKELHSTKIYSKLCSEWNR